MATAHDGTTDEHLDRGRSLLHQPVRIPVPGVVRRAVEPAPRELAGKVVSTSARILSVVLPLALAVIGFALALAGAALSERDRVEAVGALGLEVGAAMWFAGAVTLGARPRPTLLRVVLLALTGLSGLALIGVALIAGWSGVALDLAMEFGVGAVAVVVLDVVILGILQARLDALTVTPPWGATAPTG